MKNLNQTRAVAATSSQNIICAPTKIPAVSEQIARLSALVEESIRLAGEVEQRFQTVIEQSPCNDGKTSDEPPVPNRVDSLIRNSCDRLEIAHAMIRGSCERALV